MKKFLVAGLGNPGFGYRKNRHNAGYIVLDEILDSIGAKKPVKINDAKISKYEDKSGRILFVKPLSYMNNSGIVINAILYNEKIPIENLIVIYDDIDIPFNTIRYREKGSAGTHNGMRSIIEKIGSNDFKRIRIGVDRPDKGQDLARYVLSNFSKEQLKILKEEISADIKEKLFNEILPGNGEMR